MIGGIFMDKRKNTEKTVQDSSTSLELVSQTIEKEEKKDEKKGIVPLVDIFNKREEIMTEEDLIEAETEIRKCQADIINSYLKMSKYFHIVREKKLFKKRVNNEGKQLYSNFADWANKNFGFGESHSAKIANIGKKYTNGDETIFFKHIPENVKYLSMPDNQVKRKDFKLTQLMVMLPLRNDKHRLELMYKLIEHGKVHPDMNVDTIEDVVNRIRSLKIDEQGNVIKSEDTGNSGSSKSTYITDIKKLVTGIEGNINDIINADINQDNINDFKESLKKIKENIEKFNETTEEAKKAKEDRENKKQQRKSVINDIFSFLN